MKNKIFIFILIILNILSFSLKVGIYEYPPLVLNGKTGATIDFFKEIEKNLNINIEFVYSSQRDLMDKLKKRKIDILANMAYTPERAKFFKFNSEVYIPDWGVLYTSKKSNINSIMDLNNKKIAYMKTDVYFEGENGLKNILKRFNIEAELIGVENYQEIFDLLQRKKVDAGVIGRLSGKIIESNYDIKKTNIIFSPINIKFMFRNDIDKKLIDSIDAELISMKKDKKSIYYTSIGNNISKNVIFKIPENVRNILFYIIFMVIILLFSLVFYSKKLKKEVEKRTQSLSEAYEQLEATHEELMAQEEELRVTNLELEEKQKELRSIIDLVPHYIYIKDIDGKFLVVNKAYADFYGTTVEDLENKYHQEVHSKISKDELNQFLIDNIEVIKSKQIKSYERTLTSPIGDKKIFNTIKMPFESYLTNKPTVLGVSIDMTEVYKANKKIKDQNQELEETNKELEDALIASRVEKDRFINLIGIVKNISESLKQRDELFLSKLLNVAVSAIGADYGSVYRYSGKDWKFVDAIGHDIKKLKKLNLKREYFIESDDVEIINYLLENKERRLPKDISKKFNEATRTMKNSIIIPLYSNGIKVGGMSFDLDINSISVFSNEDLEIAKAFKEIASVFLTVKRYNNSLKNTYLNFANKLAMIADAYDDITGNHIYRVGKISEFIARKLKLNVQMIEEIGNFAPLHDVGKIFIPTTVLKKEGKLTSEEWEEMKKHTVYAKKLIGDDEHFKVALNMALYHHEKFDGSGYPFGKKGNDIPIEAQIVSIADIYDALRSKRPYKKELTHEEVMNILIFGDDKTKPEHFNQKILKIMEYYGDKINEIYEKMYNKV
ncbi:hypothetical protein OSSY52_01000 [Tepiditoga spiralis]|uniref:HD-GYP domain-containing protein n=1 Tax=Tepiditoga spiralis TaxID=2108365 RepID=A0A7G1G9F7_9BACT|nr:HD domain-containing phosphohydrolase [Tepiditoga spiralis]BBE29959.1 hypothetical protein OSSY52_01000 [Tepiditoga spiralis]